MTIVRVGLSETKKFAEGYDAIFGKKKNSEARKVQKAAASAAKQTKKKVKKK